MDTKERAKLAAATRWGNRKSKNTEAVWVAERLAQALKRDAKERKKVIGDNLEELLKTAHEMAEMADKLGPEDALAAACCREMKASAERVKAALGPYFRDAEKTE